MWFALAPVDGGARHLVDGLQRAAEQPARGYEDEAEEQEREGDGSEQRGARDLVVFPQSDAGDERAPANPVRDDRRRIEARIVAVDRAPRAGGQGEQPRARGPWRQTVGPRCGRAGRRSRSTRRSHRHLGPPGRTVTIGDLDRRERGCRTGVRKSRGVAVEGVALQDIERRGHQHERRGDDERDRGEQSRADPARSERSHSCSA